MAEIDPALGDDQEPEDDIFAWQYLLSEVYRAPGDALDVFHSLESREEQERMARLQEMKTGKSVKRINIKGASDGGEENHERYEP